MICRVYCRSGLLVELFFVEGNSLIHNVFVLFAKLQRPRPWIDLGGSLGAIGIPVVDKVDFRCRKRQVNADSGNVGLVVLTNAAHVGREVGHCHTRDILAVYSCLRQEMRCEVEAYRHIHYHEGSDE